MYTYRKFLTAACGALVLLLGCSNGDSQKTGDSKSAAPPPPEVERVAAVRKTLALQQQVPGRLQAVRSAEIRARVAGVVAKQVFVEGSDVSSGAILYHLDDRTLASQVRTAQAAVEKSNAERQISRQTVERYKRLVGKEAVSRQEYDQAEAQLKKANAEVSAAEATLQRARIDLEYAHITAPIDGRVGRSLVTEGALVGHNEPTHMTTIEQLDPIRVNFSQSGPDWFRLQRAIREGGATPLEAVAVRLLLDDERLYPHSGKLNFTDMAVDPQTGAVALRAEFPNPERTLLPGQFVRVQLALASSDGITVPQKAVQTSAQGQIVLMLDENSKVVARPVQTGGFSGQDWIINDGLKEGDRVIISGIQKARPGTVATAKDLPAPAATDSAASPAANR
ncbi:MAG: efflux RND transporter periplasmic adaptor subunit [Magnetococcales bacterium]|nr:efflux RND transporter periplasmic adaptor subunit [Magnetococcales bacterium]MBF0115373.1 efflux RND transporter periplasmic adaptor subunit [Magnetococcales bacterium]